MFASRSTVNPTILVRSLIGAWISVIGTRFQKSARYRCRTSKLRGERGSMPDTDNCLNASEQCRTSKLP
jgi:hypothetical protein